MKIRSHFPFDTTKLSCAAVAVQVALALCSVSAGAQSAITPPVAIPYTITTVAGNGSNGSTGNGGPAIDAALSSDLRAVAVDGEGNLYIADTLNSEIRKVNAQTGIITVLAGGGTACSAGIDKAGDGCPAATGTVLKTPRGVVVDKAGNVYIAGYGDDLVHRVDAVTGIMTLVAGYLTGTSSTCTHPYLCASGTKGYGGDGGPATQAALNQPRGVAVDNAGNVWIADTSNNVIREVSAKTGNISTVVGNFSNAAADGFGGDGGQANSTSALLYEPTDIVFDSQNNAYFADFGNHRIREVNASTNVLTTIIGNGIGSGTTPPTTAPTWPAVAATASLGSLTKLAIDIHGNLYIADSGLSLIYFYDPSAGTITPIAGEYYYAGVASSSFTVCPDALDTIGDGCPATQALFYQASSALGVAVDGMNNIYITDPFDSRVRKVSSNLSFPASAIGASGLGTQTIELHSTVNDTLSSSGISVGTSLGEFALTSPATCTPNGDNTTNCLVTVSFNPTYPGLRTAPLVVNSAHSHRSLPLTGVGQGALIGLDPGTAATQGTGLNAPLGQAFDAAGNLYIADTENNRVVEINSTTQAQTVVAGTGAAGYTGDNGLATAATLNAPASIAIGLQGFIYIADTGNNAVRAVDPVTGDISTVAGGATASTLCATASDAMGDFCPATQATLKSPAGVAIDGFGDLYIADAGNNLVRRVDSSTGYIDLEAGGSTAFCSNSTDSIGDGCPPAEAALSAPQGLAFDAYGNLYIADKGNNRVRQINMGADTIATVAGNGQSVYSGDGESATSASLNAPQAVALDAAGDIYIADTGNHVTRMVSSATGAIATLFGQGGDAGLAGGSGPTSSLQLSSPGGIAIDALGNLYVSDSGNNRVIQDQRNSSDIAYGDNNNVGQTSQAQTVTVTNIGTPVGPGNLGLSFSQTPAYVEAGTGAADFLIDASAPAACGSEILASGANCTLAIAFAPLSVNSFSAAVTFPSNAVNQATATIQLSGTGKILVNTTLSVALTSPANGKISYGQSGIVTAVVSASGNGSGTPTGTITFTVGGLQQPAVQLTNGSATLTLNLPPVGGLAIGASYSGDFTYAASNNSLTVNVTQAVTNTTLHASSTTQTPQEPNITFTATVASSTGSVPTGTVNFYNATTLMNTSPITLNAGQASFTYSDPSGSGYSVTAAYAGTTDFTSSTSAATAITIPPDFLVTASSTSLSVPQGGSAQIPSLTIASQGGISGTVTLSCTGLPANSTCTFFPTTLSFSASNPTLATSLTITTNVIPIALQSRLDTAKPDHGAPLLLGATLVSPLLFVFSGWFGFKRRNWFNAVLVIASSAILGGSLLIAGCGKNATQQTAGVTPAGTSTVQVVLTGPDNVTHSIPITLTVVANTATSSVQSSAVANNGGLQLAMIETATTPNFDRR